MNPEPTRSRSSLKDIARRVSVAPQTPRPSTAPAAPSRAFHGADTVRPVSLPTQPPASSAHPALNDLARICERSLQEGAARTSMASESVFDTYDEPVTGRIARAPAPAASRWRTVAPILGGTLVAIAAVAISAVVLTRTRVPAPSAPAALQSPANAAVIVPAAPEPVAAPEPTPTPTETPAVAEVNVQRSEPAAATKADVARPAVAQPAQNTVVTPEPPAAASPPPATNPSPETARPGDLSSAMAAAVATESAAKTEEAEAAPAVAPPDGSIPENPSQGAIQAALSSVRENARSCVVGMDDASRATVVFGSSGSVARVSVSGAAAGKKAESCVRSALSAAKIPPFRKSSFSVGLTLRP